MQISMNCWMALLFAMTFALGLSGPLHAEEAGTAQRVGEKVDYAMNKAGEGINKAADATGRGLSKAAQATEHGISKAVEATGKGLQTVGEKLQNAVHPQSLD